MLGSLCQSRAVTVSTVRAGLVFFLNFGGGFRKCGNFALMRVKALHLASGETSEPCDEWSARLPVPGFPLLDSGEGHIQCPR